MGSPFWHVVLLLLFFVLSFINLCSFHTKTVKLVLSDLLLISFILRGRNVII